MADDLNQPADPTLETPRTRFWRDMGVVFGLPVLMFAVAWRQPVNAGVTWFVVLGILAVSVVLTGQRVTGLWRGFLIDGRNMVSLSRFQMIVWTILVLSGFLMAVITNLARGAVDPLAVAIPYQLWVLMGISTTSLIGSPLVLTTKIDKEAAGDQEDATDRRRCHQIGIAPQRLGNVGVIFKNPKPEFARLSDMFKGEEVGNAATLDLAKIQMFYFTIVLAVTYGAGLAQMFTEPLATISALPAIPESMLALLGISHTAYLSGKALTHTKETNPAESDPNPTPPKKRAVKKRTPKKGS